jgi:hypothetical protein
MLPACHMLKNDTEMGTNNDSTLHQVQTDQNTTFLDGGQVKICCFNWWCCFAFFFFLKM